MTPEEKQQLKEKIEKKIQSTEKAIIDYKEFTQPVAPENAIGRLSRMEAINNKSVMEAALREAEAKHDRLVTSLSQVNDPMFGHCKRCGEEIPFKRLMAMPDAHTCMKCKL